MDTPTTNHSSSLSSVNGEKSQGVAHDINTNHEPLTSRVDLELNRIRSVHLINDLVHSFAWDQLTVQVKDHKTKKPLSILSNSNGIVHAGEMLAIMGPSGSGKTTLLSTIAHREAAARATTNGSILVNGQVVGIPKLRQLSSFVEQEDALIGSLTVWETMHFAAGLALSSTTSRRERRQRIDDLIGRFGLQEQSQTIVGTPIKKGLSGGQKKRLGVASRLVTDPKILFLDEPTSGLDSTLSFEIMNYIKAIAKKHNLIIIASIHQPSTSTFRLFDKLCLLSKGQMCYFGPASEGPAYFSSIGYAMPPETNPAEFYLDLINTDLVIKDKDLHAQVQDITTKWAKSLLARQLQGEVESSVANAKTADSDFDISKIKPQRPSPWSTPLVLLHRSWIKAYRDVVAYGIRIIMYLGLAILMGTVFLRLKGTQDSIQTFMNAIFFGSAFMSFMVVAYVPAFLEDLHTFDKERANGLVGPLAFSVANFIVGLPFLYIIALLFSTVAYFLIGFRLDGNAFFTFTFWLFLDLVAAEALVVLVSVIFKVFVVALAVAALLNGLWMCVSGFLVPINALNSFWKYAFHYIDYQAYAFQGMMVNEFKDRVYSCLGTALEGYHCMYPSDINVVGKIRGSSVLETLGIEIGHEKLWVGLIIAIIAVYRVLAYLVLRLRRN